MSHKIVLVRITRIDAISIHLPEKAVPGSKHEGCGSDPEEQEDYLDGDAEDRAYGAGAAGEGVAGEVVRYYCVQGYGEG